MSKTIQVKIPVGYSPYSISTEVMQAAIEKLDVGVGLPGKLGGGGDKPKYLNYVFDPSLMDRSVVSHIARTFHTADGYVCFDLEIMQSFPGKFLELLLRGKTPIDFIIEGVGTLSEDGQTITDYSISTVSVYPIPATPRI
ncbi:hypothetical protein M0R04_14945 [Candidatus Dojkabacteria bacterium]|jgi:hypothetical protein|nr:hypothetical protein [Candidatus Dojkabacteria bacterium]